MANLIPNVLIQVFISNLSLINPQDEIKTLFQNTTKLEFRLLQLSKQYNDLLEMNSKVVLSVKSS